MKRTLITLLGALLLTGCGAPQSPQPTPTQRIELRKIPKEELGKLVEQYSIENKTIEKNKIEAVVYKKGTAQPIYVNYTFHDGPLKDYMSLDSKGIHFAIFDSNIDGVIDDIFIDDAYIHNTPSKEWETRATLSNTEINQYVNHGQKLYDVYRTLLEVEKHRPKKVLPTPTELPF